MRTLNEHDSNLTRSNDGDLKAVLLVLVVEMEESDTSISSNDDDEIVTLVKLDDHVCQVSHVTYGELSMQWNLEWHIGVVMCRTVEGAREIDTCDIDTSADTMRGEV